MNRKLSVTTWSIFACTVLGGCADRSVSRGDDVSRPEAYGLVQPVTPARQPSPKIITDPDQHLEYQRRTGDVPASGR